MNIIQYKSVLFAEGLTLKRYKLFEIVVGLDSIQDQEFPA